jgi:arginine decarboxylase
MFSRGKALNTPEGDIRMAYFLSYDERLCDYFVIDDGSMEQEMNKGRELVSAGFVIPYPPGFPILVPGQVISKEILNFMRALDVKEIHGYRSDLGLRVFSEEALITGSETAPVRVTVADVAAAIAHKVTTEEDKKSPEDKSNTQD